MRRSAGPQRAGRYNPCMSKRDPRPAPTRRLLLQLLTGAGLGAAGLARWAQAQNLPAGTQGIHIVQGDVRINGDAAAQGSLVRAGEAVTTGPGALAMFVIGQDAFLMRADSRAEFTGIDLALNSVRLLTGKLLSVFAAGQGKRLDTPSATIGIRGTGAYLEAEDDRTYFCLCYGSAEIATVAGDARDAYETTHHESPRYIYGDRREQAIVPANVSNHTDAELIMLEALVGRSPPQGFMDSPIRY